MTDNHYDVFNGDADGVLSLLQLRKHNPRDSHLVTGVKRDIQLLCQVPDTATSVTVLDVSMEKNHMDLERLLALQIPVFYADHHRSGNISTSTYLTAQIDTHANVCTGLIVSNYLHQAYHSWAIAAACGDNLLQVAEHEAKSLKLTESQFHDCHQLGQLVNYNGYGSTVDDLYMHPADVVKALLHYQHPWHVLLDSQSFIHGINQQYKQDLALARNSELLYSTDTCSVIKLDDASWARRISGVYANQLANRYPDKAHGIVTHNTSGQYTVSIRAPLNNKQYAGDICSQFETGGGRAAAGGINHICEGELPDLYQLMQTYYHG